MDVGPTGFYQGTGTASATHFRERYINGESGSWRLDRSKGSDAGPITEGDRKASESSNIQDDGYVVEGPDWQVPTTIATVDSNGNTSITESRAHASTGEQEKSQFWKSSSGTPSVGDAGSGETSDGSDGQPRYVGWTTATFPTDQCGTVLSKTFRQPLRVGYLAGPPNCRLFHSPNGPGPEVGRKRLSWQLLPGPFDEGSRPDHFTCPE